MADNFNLRSFLIENKLTKNAQLLKEETSQGSDISGYWVMYGGLNKGIKEFIKMFPSQEQAQQALEDAPTTYGQHVLRGYWGIIPAQEWLASGGEIGPNQIGHPDRIAPKRLSPEERQAIRQLDFDAEMERESVDKKKPVMEAKLTAKERRLVEMVQRALKEEENVDYTMGRQDDPNQLPNPAPELNIPEGDEMANEKVLPKYESIDQLMQEIEHGTNEAAYKHKMSKMKEVAEMLEAKVGSLEEGEGADFVDTKKVKQMKKDIMTLRKQAEKLEKEYDKKFNKKEGKKEEK